ncbi:hypothetical protein [Chryseobacterium limigenitum]|uniref:Uncharacterized protein n=1 Tax=Chryseobacterium limigenitum TaxID=1612149 RepID=A0A1K2IQ33_9FLAO|nr:hypothetical protein [Chryseobacterium limigenitum]SFZ94557.1 hypothetical protein SAMN05216324_10772 [Chryseobacterium limigenitum]
MIEILETIYNFLGKLLPFSFGIAFIGFIMSFIAKIIKSIKFQRACIFLLLQVFVLGIIMVLLQTIIIRKIRNEILEILSDPQTQIIISRNDFEILPQDLKKELLKIQDISPNHTGPENQKSVEIISSKGIFKIFIGRDSGNKTQFWIFTDKYKFSEEAEIGRVNSTLIK